MQFNTAFNLFPINSSREGLKADDKSVGESVSEIMEDNHFSSQRWEEKIGRDGEREDGERR